MRFELFPEKEFTLISSCTLAEVVDEISANVMERDIVTIDFWSEFQDKRISRSRYFEGYVKGADFNINGKTYTRVRTDFNSIDIKPVFKGNVREVDGLVEVNVKIERVSPVLFLIFIILSILMPWIIPNTTPIACIFFNVCSMIYWIIFIAAKKKSYARRIQKDIDQLRLICKSN